MAAVWNENILDYCINLWILLERIVIRNISALGSLEGYSETSFKYKKIYNMNKLAWQWLKAIEKGLIFSDYRYCAMNLTTF